MFNSITFGTIKLSVNTRVLNKHIPPVSRNCSWTAFHSPKFVGPFLVKLTKRSISTILKLQSYQTFVLFFHGRKWARPENLKASGVFGVRVCSKFKSFGRGVLTNKQETCFKTFYMCFDQFLYSLLLIIFI